MEKLPDDFEEEEFLLYVELDSQNLSVDHIRNANKIKMFGIDTQKPLLQINNLFYEGNFDYSMGTHLFYQKNEEIPVDDLYSKCESYYENIAKTNKVLKMKRVMLKSKEEGANEEQIEERIDEENDLIKSKTYEEALNKLLKPGRAPPRIIVANETIDEVQKSTESMEIDDK